MRLRFINSVDEVSIGDKIYVREDCQWITQRSWTGKPHYIHIEDRVILADMSENEGADQYYWYRANDIAIIEVEISLDPEFSLEEINSAEEMLK